MNLLNLTIEKTQQNLRNREYTAQELTLAYLDKIKETDSEIQAYLNLTEELALKQAIRADKMLSHGEAQPLTGIPCAIKDNILVAGEKCTAGSKFLENYIAPYDATVIEKLKNQGAVILGKTNLDEFAMGSSCENSAFYPTKNPRDLTRVPGGSSGGSAAAVAADMCVFALGSDTGGSIRQPAGFCGISGLKPTYGSVSRYGLIAFASSLDQIGPLAKNSKDCQIVFEAIQGKDPYDSTSNDFPKNEKWLNIKNLKIGVPKEYLEKGLDPIIEKNIKSALKFYKDNGAEIINLSLPHTKVALACYYIIAPSEASANLARFDGIRYGELIDSKQSNDILDVYLKNRSLGFGPEVKRRIMLGTYTLSAGYYDAYYKKALKVRTLIKDDFAKAFEKVDLIIGPITPILPFKIGEKINDPLSMYLADIYTVSVNLAGLPAISIPCGSADELPVGLQLIAPAFEEETLFFAADFFEKNYYL
ncbi:MAG TPA: Asp-tRNA(Asn)/Glu-tRNA(Gln) amidotransferase subunit GatA [Candidatus Paceibacterota bacterium]|nr:Asp-tRNA(Asn)/Glu-tRNA(Gln) amidotransferase subunit GatA [Candidatus Pacearchaeota archaeon]HPC30436.1 Asp-tRNA(Asn)/Glu-tRNA(Gln) amidotransferase subunit GatA [Candidatus Pacearchaeota archaeon]HQK58573.1 Asp-tRNA(Asn)/Glu-tRNA(Gln) amidotransferase subunit GatA [Candidatus Pacearchaeota archaeon]HRR94571.1 Asp-tRNA(Asn)/Glu-tRNA(Gln) amidotransferase subunit GatA [Candidatus Paceibacterota bacterium]HRU20655.1 Asp-tRNA(Asn)/Glu-tRNA(Gln) amidotransferase subunit GatA [Candidatus Paceibac